MTITFAVVAVLIIASAVAAMTLRNLVHCALALSVTFTALAALFLQLDAQFVGFAQILVYVGAVAILIVFATLLTRSSESTGQVTVTRYGSIGVGVAVIVFGLLARVIMMSRRLTTDLPPAPSATVRQIGDQLMTRFILPLELIGLLLTAALIGAVIIAMHGKEGNDSPSSEFQASRSNSR